MSTTTVQPASEPATSTTLPLVQMEAQMPASEPLDRSNSAGPSSSGGQTQWQESDVTVDDIFSALSSSVEVNQEGVTAMDILARAWRIFRILLFGSLMVLMSGSSNPPGDTDDAASSPVVPPRPHVKITPWRILNTSVLLILGTYKAVSTYLGETMAPTNLDWTMGVIWALISYWVSIIEQDAPSIAPWFLTADFSRPMRIGAAGFFVALSAGVYWAVIYGLMASMFARPIHWNVLRAISVGIAGFLAPIVLLLGGLALWLPYGIQIRKFFNMLRFPRFWNRVFRCSDLEWQRMINMSIIMAVFWLSPFGATYLIAKRRSHNMEFESELKNMLHVGVVVPCTAIFSVVLTALMIFGDGIILTPGFRLMRSAYNLLGNLVRRVYRHACMR